MQGTRTHQMRNALKLAEEKRRLMRQERAAVANIEADLKSELAKQAKQVAIVGRRVESPPLNVPETRQEIGERFNLTYLESLTTAHMDDAQRKGFEDMIVAVRRWRRAVKEKPNLSFILSSSQVGIGKTHVAKAVRDSFAELAYYDGGNDISLVRHGRFFTAGDLMIAMTPKNFSPDPPYNNRHVDSGIGALVRYSTKIVVVDDLGREPALPYVKQDKESQKLERQRRYFEFINACYERGVAVFMTTNMPLGDLEDFFGEATWSRLNEMAPKGFMYQIEGLVDYRQIKGGRA